MQISLACYSLRIRPQNSRRDLDLSDERAAPVFDFLKSTLEALLDRSKNNTASKKVLTIRRIEGERPNISGIISTGEYGYESELIDVKGARPRYKRSTQQAEMLPFYFHLYFPVRGACGALILQRFGLFGVRTILLDHLLPLFRDRFPELTLSVWPQVPDGVLEHLLESGEAKKITLRKFTVPNDLAATLGENGGRLSASVDLVITGKHGHRFQPFLRKVRNAFTERTDQPLNDLVEFDGFAHDKVLVTIEVAGRPQTVDLTNMYKLRANIDVTSRVRLGPDGHPVFESISAESNRVLRNIRDALNI